MMKFCEDGEIRIPKGFNHSAQRLARVARAYPGNDVPKMFPNAESVESNSCEMVFEERSVQG